MKLLSYNILNGGSERLPSIMNIITDVRPDVVAIQEANGFDAENKRILNSIQKGFGFVTAELSLSPNGYHVATFSKFPSKKVTPLQNFRNAGLLTEFSSPGGTFAICNIHLTPYTEEDRLKEMETVFSVLKQYPDHCICGDMNSLSPEDGYDPGAIPGFNEKQKAKFTRDNQFHFEIHTTMKEKGYKDAAVLAGKNKVTTVPTPALDHPAHGDFRLDYVYLSPSCPMRLVSYGVIKNEITNRASDHYPVVVELS